MALPGLSYMTYDSLTRSFRDVINKEATLKRSWVGNAGG